MGRSPGLGVPYWGVLPPTLRSSFQQPPKPHQSAHVIPHLMLMATRPACELGLSQMQWFTQHSVGPSPQQQVSGSIHGLFLCGVCTLSAPFRFLVQRSFLVWGLFVYASLSLLKGSPLGRSLSGSPQHRPPQAGHTWTAAQEALLAAKPAGLRRVPGREAGGTAQEGREGLP